MKRDGLPQVPRRRNASGAQRHASPDAGLDAFISEDEIVSAMRDMAAHENYIIEGAAGVALAAGLKDASKYQGRKIAVVVCGRNIGLDTFLSIMGPTG